MFPETLLLLFPCLTLFLTLPPLKGSPLLLPNDLPPESTNYSNSSGAPGRMLTVGPAEKVIPPDTPKRRGDAWFIPMSVEEESIRKPTLLTNILLILSTLGIIGAIVISLIGMSTTRMEERVLKPDEGHGEIRAKQRPNDIDVMNKDRAVIEGSVSGIEDRLPNIKLNKNQIKEFPSELINPWSGFEDVELEGCNAKSALDLFSPSNSISFLKQLKKHRYVSVNDKTQTV